jgi:Protein of unknown function (DUF732)
MLIYGIDDDAYLDAMAAHNIHPVGGPADLIQVGHQVCELLSPSVSPAMVTNGVYRASVCGGSGSHAPITNSQAGILVNDAIGTYCPNSPGPVSAERFACSGGRQRRSPSPCPVHAMTAPARLPSSTTFRTVTLSWYGPSRPQHPPRPRNREGFERSRRHIDLHHRWHRLVNCGRPHGDWHPGDGRVRTSSNPFYPKCLRSSSQLSGRSSDAAR